MSHFTTMQSGYVNIANVAPIINNPTAGDITIPTPSYTVPQGSPYRFFWTIDDVLADLAGTGEPVVSQRMTVTWIWGDGNYRCCVWRRWLHRTYI